jgi:hypothetical protein
MDKVDKLREEVLLVKESNLSAVVEPSIIEPGITSWRAATQSLVKFESVRGEFNHRRETLGVLYTCRTPMISL